MQLHHFFTCILFISCTSSVKRNPDTKNSARTEVIRYLKKEFHVSIDASKIDSNNKKYLKETGQSLEPDLLINSKIFIAEFKPLNLSFIRYYNYFDTDSSRESHFAIFLIKDEKNNFYIDYINPNAGMIKEDFCSWSELDKILKTEDNIKLSKENIDAYNKINSSRIYGESDFPSKDKKLGLQSYLNNTFRFKMPTKSNLDSLFKVYDSFLYFENDTLLKNFQELYDYLRIQSSRIKSEPAYGPNDFQKKYLTYLKEQISLLLLQTKNVNDKNLFLWIYRNDSRLRIRRLYVSGNSKCSYSYFIDENNICF